MREKIKSYDEYIVKLNEINKNIEVIDKYIDYKTLITHRCKKYGYTWKASPNITLNSTGCPILDKRRILIVGYNDLMTTHPDLITEWDFNKNNLLLPTQITAGCNKKVWWKDKQGHEWEDSICHRTSGRGCPICANEMKISDKEIKVYYYIHKYFPDAILNYKNTKKGISEIDIYIPSIKVGIEYDGQFYHQDIDRDKKKDSACNNNRIKLFRIREPDCPKYNSNQCSFIYLNNISNITLENAIMKILKTLSVTEYNINFDRDIKEIELIKQRKKKENNLLECFHDITEEWNYEKNGNIKPEHFSCGSHKKVWWKCKTCFHEWQTSIYNRTKDTRTGCPKCSLLRSKQAKYKPVYCPELNKIYNSIDEAALQTNNSNININAVLRGHQQTTGKDHLHWYYVYDQYTKNGDCIRGAITLGLVDEQTIIKLIKNKNILKKC